MDTLVLPERSNRTQEISSRSCGGWGLAAATRRCRWWRCSSDRGCWRWGLGCWRSRRWDSRWWRSTIGASYTFRGSWSGRPATHHRFIAGWQEAKVRKDRNKKKMTIEHIPARSSWKPPSAVSLGLGLGSFISSTLIFGCLFRSRFSSRSGCLLNRGRNDEWNHIVREAGCTCNWKSHIILPFHPKEHRPHQWKTWEQRNNGAYWIQLLCQWLSPSTSIHLAPPCPEIKYQY